MLSMMCKKRSKMIDNSERTKIRVGKGERGVPKGIAPIPIMGS